MDADNTTVVGGPLSTIGEDDQRDRSPSYTKGKGAVLPANDLASKTFIGAVDYLETERPFFFRIGKDGLISALNKLDRQLQNVSCT